MWGLAVALLAATFGCGAPTSLEDAGREDAALIDAGQRDAGLRDAATPQDAGPVDAAPSDAGDVGWRAEPSLPAAVQEISVVAHGGRVVVAGGFEAGAIVATVRAFDPALGTWEELAPLLAPRHHMVLVSFGADLYAFGGMQTTAFEPLDTAWVLRDGASTWASVANLPEDRGAMAADRVGDVIVLAGGNSSRGGLAETTLVYEPATDTWRSGAPIPTEREHLAAVGVDGELFVIAGRLNSLSSNRSTLEIYDPAADTWRSGPELGMARGGFDGALIGDGVVVVGGEQPDRALDSVERFDLSAQRWSPLPSVPTPRHGHGVAVVEGRLYVVGGADRPIFAAVDVVESIAL